MGFNPFKAIKKVFKKAARFVKKVVKSKAFKVLAAVALIAVGAAYFSAAAFQAMPGFVQATASAIPGFNTIGAGATMAANAANAAATAQATAQAGGSLKGFLAGQTSAGGALPLQSSVASATSASTAGAVKGGLLAHLNANPVTTMALTSGVGAGMQAIAAADQADKDRKALAKAESDRRKGMNITPSAPVDVSGMRSTRDYGLGIGGDREERHNKEVERLRGLINGRSKRPSPTPAG